MRGNILLILFQLSSLEVDKTGGSYYGKQQLNYMSVKVRHSAIEIFLSD